MNASRRPRGLDVLLILALVLVWPGLNWAAEPLGATYVLVAPTNTLSHTRPVTLGVILLNSTTGQMTQGFPPTLHGRLILGERTLNVELKRTPPGPHGLVVPPGGFARQDYLLELPEAVEGLVVVEVPLLGARVGLQVSASVSAAKAGLEKVVQQAQPPFSAQEFFKDHISGYEPFYFIASTESPNAKFQISLKYQLISRHSKLAARAPVLEGFHFAYSQTSLWDWNGPSAPFFDSSYRPEILYYRESILGGHNTNWYRLDLSAGVQHESNGKGDTNSRSLNVIYFRPTLTLGRPDQLQWSLSPRVWAYLGDLSDNPDIKEYRGYADLRMVLGWARGLQLSALGRVGNDWERGSVQLDLTYPLMSLLSSSFSVYFHAQYFNGYGESLLLYDRKGSSWRLGFALFR